MTTLRSVIRRRPVLSFYVVVFTISWGGMLLLVGPGGIPSTAERVEALFPAALLILFAGPSIGGLLLTGLVDGRAGYRDLRARLLHWRVAGRWYAVALFFAPLLVAGVLFTLSLFSPAYLPGILSADDKWMLVLFGVAWGLLGGGLLEEVGWTGFAVPRLRRSHGAVATGLTVGLLWGLWHLLIAFWAGGALTGDDSLAIYIAGFLAFYFGALPPFRVLMVWVYDRTESLPVAMLMHAGFSAATLILQPLSTGTPYFVWNLALAVVLWVILAWLALAGRRRHAPLRTSPISGAP